MKPFKILVCVLLLAATIVTAFGCKKQIPPDEIPTESDSDWWTGFFEGRGHDATAATTGMRVSKPSYGYGSVTEQGYGGWYYGCTTNGEYREAEYLTDAWRCDGAVLNRSYLTSTANACATRKYVNPYESGAVTVSGTLKGDGIAGHVTLYAFLGEHRLCEVSVDTTDTVGIYYEFSCDLLCGDELYFVLQGDGTAQVEPLICYGSDEARLHAQNDTGYFGDLIPVYNPDDRKMYMYYMTGDVSDLAHPVVEMHLAVSDDLFRFVETEYEIKPFVDRAVNLRFFKKSYQEIFDFGTFPNGYRDMYILFDRQINRWRYVALCYYERSGMIKCALGTGISDDETGDSWTTPIKVLQNYPLFKQPECPCAAYIGDRWYIFCSLWGESIHNVGRLRYYVGDPGKTIDEQDWTTKQAHYLDGEDLCAAQIVDIGGKYLMYGWIVKCYEDQYFPKVIDNGLWGGDMNLPREVYQTDDGLLALRMPEYIKNMCKKGVVKRGEDVTVNGDSKRIAEGGFGSSFISGKLDFAGSDRTAVVLRSDGKEYEIRFCRENGKVTMYIGCDADLTHPVASFYETGEALTSINLDIIVEGNTLEVFVNDQYALSARTSMFSGKFQSIELRSEGTARAHDFMVHKLANCYNVFD